MAARKPPEQREAEVIEACQALEAKGQAVTIQAVVDRAGGGNSSAVKYIKKWKTNKSTVPPGVDPILARAYQTMKEDIAAAVNEDLQEAKEAQALAEERAEAAEAEAARATKEAQDAKAEAAKARERQDKAEADQIERQVAADTANAELAGNKAALKGVLTGLAEARAALEKTAGTNHSAFVQTLSHARDIKESHETFKSSVASTLEKLHAGIAGLDKSVQLQMQETKAAIEHVLDGQTKSIAALNQGVVEQSDQHRALVGRIDAIEGRMRSLIEEAVSFRQEEFSSQIMAAIEPIADAATEAHRRLTSIEDQIKRLKGTGEAKRRSKQEKTQEAADGASQ